MLDFNFFKTVKLKCFPEISNKLYQLHKDKFNVTKTSAVKLDWTEENFLELYTEINQFVFPRKVMISRVFITKPHGSLGVHVDKDLNPNAYALNVPILFDTKNHLMNWFNYDGPLEYKQTETYNRSVSPADPQKLILKESLTITEPTFVQVGIFHNVENNSSIPRIILSIRFTDSFKV